MMIVIDDDSDSDNDDYGDGDDVMMRMSVMIYDDNDYNNVDNNDRDKDSSVTTAHFLSVHGLSDDSSKLSHILVKQHINII